jgi:hypothetical protein
MPYEMIDDFDRVLSGSSKGSFANIKKGSSKFLKITDEPSLGGLVYFDAKSRPGGHVGIVANIYSDGTLDIIEGNTNGRVTVVKRNPKQDPDFNFLGFASFDEAAVNDVLQKYPMEPDDKSSSPDPTQQSMPFFPIFPIRRKRKDGGNGGITETDSIEERKNTAASSVNFSRGVRTDDNKTSLELLGKTKSQIVNQIKIFFTDNIKGINSEQAQKLADANFTVWEAVAKTISGAKGTQAAIAYMMSKVAQIGIISSAGEARAMGSSKFQKITPQMANRIVNNAIEHLKEPNKKGLEVLRAEKDPKKRNDIKKRNRK